jgi:hypothetical protein
VRANRRAKNIIWSTHYRKMPNIRGAGARALSYLMRPNDRLAGWLADKYLEFWRAKRGLAVTSRSQLISVHIRWSDKLADGDLHPVSKYLEYVLSIADRWQIEQPVVFLSSEDGSAISLFEQAVASHPKASHVRVVKYDYHRISQNCGGLDIGKLLGVQGSGMKKAEAPSLLMGNTSKLTFKKRSELLLTQGTCATPSDLKDHARKYSEDLTLISLLNLYLALECRHIICLTASNWCWMLRYLADQDTTTITGEYALVGNGTHETKFIMRGPQGPGTELRPKIVLPRHILANN